MGARVRAASAAILPPGHATSVIPDCRLAGQPPDRIAGYALAAMFLSNRPEFEINPPTAAR